VKVSLEHYEGENGAEIGLETINSTQMSLNFEFLGQNTLIAGYRAI
jgi:hypothetical protein